MRKFLCIILLSALLMPIGTAYAADGSAAPGEASESSAQERAVSALSGPIEEPPFEIGAPSALLVEAESGRVIFEKNAEEKRSAASINKLMTLLIVFEAMDEGRFALTDTVRVSRNAALTSGSQALLDGDTDYAATDLLKSVIVASANDSAVALAEHLYGSEAAFVRRMNERARELGLSDTLYQNCTGLTAENQYTTARDIAQLSRVVARHDLLYEYSGIWLDELIHTRNNRKTDLTNTNRLIRTYDGADGLKTGSTSEALFCISASAQRGGMRLIAVVLGAPSSAERFSLAAKMLDYGFDHFYLYEIARQGQMVREALPVKGGGELGVNIIAGEAVRGMIMKGEEGDINFEINLPEQIEAPLEKGEAVGEIVIYKGADAIARIPAVTERQVDSAGYMGSVKRILAYWML